MAVSVQLRIPRLNVLLERHLDHNARNAVVNLKCLQRRFRMLRGRLALPEHPRIVHVCQILNTIWNNGGEMVSSLMRHSMTLF